MKQYIVDAFTDQVFGGNQAAVVILSRWPSPSLMQSIARENRFSETAFVMKEGEGYRLRYFTPGGEIDFCGHATLGTSYVLFRFYEKERGPLTLLTEVGKLTVSRRGELIEMDFPSYRCLPVEVTPAMEEALGVRPIEAYLDRDLLLILPGEEAVRNLEPDLSKVRELPGTVVAVSARGEGGEYACVSRCFAPRLSIGEDPVTGSSHCMITPYWCKRLKKESLVCLQASERGGVLYTRLLEGGRIQVAGRAALFSQGEILEDWEQWE